MKNSKKILAIIPARGGSKRIPQKNIKLFAGKPLITHTIEEALKSKYLDRLVVSTEDSEISNISKEYKAEVVERPKELAEDTTPTQPILEHIISYLEKKEGYKPDIIVILQCTSPLRKHFHINESIEKFFKEDYDSLLSVCPSKHFFWKTGEKGAHALNYDFRKRIRTQDKGIEYRENGAVYVTKYDIIMNNHNILDKKIGLYIMPEENSIEIDTEFDFWLAEQIYNKI